MRPQSLGGATCATQHKDRPQNQKEFAADTAGASGESKAQVNRHLARAEALGDDLDEVAGTSLDKGVELDALKDMDPEDRRELIGRAKAGENVRAPAKIAGTTGSEGRESSLLMSFSGERLLL